MFLLYEEQVAEFSKIGLITPYFKNPIPNKAYVSINEKQEKYSADLLEMINDKNCSRSEIDRFLHIFGDIGFKNKSKEGL